MLGLGGRAVPQADSYDQAVLSEIQMVMEFIAGTSDETLTAISVDDPDDPAKKLTLPEMAGRLDGIEAVLDERKRLNARQKTLLLSVRDAVNTKVHPASGLTIAYTALVLHSSRGRFDKARTALAHRAFPGLVWTARWHRMSHYMLIAIAACLTSAAVWESTRIALGHALLNYRSELRTQQAAISVEKTRLEAELARAGGTPLDRSDIGGQHVVFRLCDRPRALLYAAQHAPPATAKLREAVLQTGDPPQADPLQQAALPEPFETPEQQDVCDRDRLLAYHFASSTDRLRNYNTDWPAMVGAPFPFIRYVARATMASINEAASAKPREPPQPPPARSTTNRDDDLEYDIAPVLLVTGNYVLPVIFAMLGASVYVIRDFYGKACTNRLVPGDVVLAWIRLMLGVVVGACVGLFFSSGEPATATQADGLVAALTLSASGLAFIGGYGVEGVFSMLNALVDRVFNTKAAATKP